jgi:hypothetical protein
VMLSRGRQVQAADEGFSNDSCWPSGTEVRLMLYEQILEGSDARFDS